MPSNDVASQVLHPMPSMPRAVRGFDAALLGALGMALARAPCGRLRVTMPSGRAAVVGRADQDIVASLHLRSYRAILQSARRGVLGFAEAYMDGAIDIDDLRALFRYYLDNEAALVSAGRGMFRYDARDRVYHRQRANTRTGSRRNIAAHYDLGNDFYRLWLDGGMTYSSGIYAHPGATLEDAQREKYDRIVAALGLAAGQRVLEIGCGWGGFAESAARAGCDVTAITISEQQRTEAASRLARLDLAGQARVELRDYRDTSGSYDRIASIEMIEAVGEENWQTYFDTISARLAAGGIAVIQAITIHPDLFGRYRSHPDFIQRYVFPGGMLPTEGAMREHAEAAGLAYERVETFGRSYATTLATWRKRFLDAWPDIERLGFDERFRRMWLYYLDYCEVGFERGSVDVGLYRVTKPA